MKEEYLLSGPLEATNEPYAVAKIAGIKMCQAFNRQFGTRFISVMPTNLYGPGDNFDLETSHVLPALIRKFHEAKVRGQRSEVRIQRPEANGRSLKGVEAVTVWGTGAPCREFLHVDDLADACLFLMGKYDDSEIINIGVGKEITIKELAGLVGDIVGFKGEIHFDTSKPDGTPRKLLDVGKLHALGWRNRIGLPEGISSAYEWYVEERLKAQGSRLKERAE